MREALRRVVPYGWRRRMVDVASTWRADRRFARARRAFRTLAHGRVPAPDHRWGTMGEAKPVVMCLWRRPELLSRSLAALAAQDVPEGVHLTLWNNDPANDDYYREILGTAVHGSLRGIDFHSSGTNIGGAARMIVGRVLCAQGYTGPVVLIDDDQIVGSSFVGELLDRWSPGTFGGTWAWRMHGDYWDRSRATGGQSATYVGTGGSVVDAELLADAVLLRRLDSEDLMCEDILLSARAHELGSRVVAIGAEFEFVVDAHDQWHALADAKSVLYEREGQFALFPRSADDSTSHRA